MFEACVHPDGPTVVEAVLSRWMRQRLGGKPSLLLFKALE